ncbi:MAG: HEAT repeat domain-containing protein [Gemmatimonadetes bacterium]|jgi:HEAT repeat protein|nr:HEAT repeat domain-containing protein [Gemmatimonadota bacterium]
MRWIVSLGAVFLLAGCSQQRAQGHIRFLSSPDREVRQRASQALVEMGNAAVAPVVASLDSASDSLAYIGAQILGRIGSPRAILCLRELAQRDNPYVRREAVAALGQTGHRPLVPVLAEFLTVDHDTAVRVAAAKGLATLRDTLAVPPLLAALRDTAALVRQQSLVSLQHLWSTRVEAAARRRLGDPDETVRFIAAQMLGTHRAHESRLALSSALTDTSVFVRVEAARALGQLGDTAAVKSLVKLLKRGDGPDSEAARRALLVLTDLDYVVLD